MEEWKQHIIGAIAIIIIGLVLLLWATNMEIPAPYKTFLGIPYGVNPEYYYMVNQMLMFLLFSILLVGLGFGMLGSTYSIYKFEKKSATIEPKAQGKFFCRFCAKENKPDAMYCEGCGKKL